MSGSFYFILSKTSPNKELWTDFDLLIGWIVFYPDLPETLDWALKLDDDDDDHDHDDNNNNNTDILYSVITPRKS